MNKVELEKIKQKFFQMLKYNRKNFKKQKNYEKYKYKKSHQW